MQETLKREKSGDAATSRRPPPLLPSAFPFLDIFRDLPSPFAEARISNTWRRVTAASSISLALYLTPPSPRPSSLVEKPRNFECNTLLDQGPGGGFYGGKSWASPHSSSPPRSMRGANRKTPSAHGESAGPKSAILRS
jgi:hypothetical protein